jgi:putative endonuclease
VPKLFYVYILASFRRALYVGMTNDIRRRVHEHWRWKLTACSSRYRTRYLVYIEAFPTRKAAIARETEIKKWRREKKRRLIESVNPTWHDMTLGW